MRSAKPRPTTSPSVVNSGFFGGDCLSYGLLSSGFNDLVCEADLKPYDYFALTPVVQGAGGVISDWQGNELTLESEGQVLAAGQRTTAPARAGVTKR